MVSAIDSLNKKTRQVSAGLVASIKEAREKNVKGKQQIKEISKELTAAQKEFETTKAGFLELTDEEQFDRAVEIQRLENRLEHLSRTKNRLNHIIPRNEAYIEECLEKLDDLRKTEFEGRQELARKKEAQIAQSQGHEAVVKLIEKRFITPFEELDKFTVEEAKEDPQWLTKAEKLFHEFGLPFPNRAMKAFPGSETKDFPADLFESVRVKLSAVRALLGVR